MYNFTSYHGSQFSYHGSQFFYHGSSFSLSKFTTGASDFLGSLDNNTPVRTHLYIYHGWDFYLRKFTTGGKLFTMGGNFFTMGGCLKLSTYTVDDNMVLSAVA